MKKTIIGALVAASTLFTSVGMSFGDLLVPLMSYRVGPYAANGTMNANGFVDYLTMLNERDGGIGGVKIKLKNAKQAIRPKRVLNVMSPIEEKPLVHTPNSTGITLQSWQNHRKIRHQFIHGLWFVCTAKGETFPGLSITNILLHSNDINLNILIMRQD